MSRPTVHDRFTAIDGRRAAAIVAGCKDHAWPFDTRAPCTCKLTTNNNKEGART